MLGGVVIGIAATMVADKHLDNMTERKATDLFLKTPIGPLAEGLGVNPNQATALVSKEPDEVIENFPYKIDSILATVKGFKKLTQFIYYIGFVVILGILIGYVCLVLCWCLLGAILNPD